MSTAPFNPQCIALIFATATVLCFLIVYIARCKIKSQELKHKETMEDKRKVCSKEKELMDHMKTALRESIVLDCKEVIKNCLDEAGKAAQQDLAVAKAQIEIYEKFLNKKA